MDMLNVSFLEEYKRLDRLCCEIYRADKGITSYIEDMKSKELTECQFPHTWNSDLSNLLRLRKIRNQLTHEIGTLNVPLCTQADVDWLQGFRQKIYQAADPLALLHKMQSREDSSKPASYMRDAVKPDFTADDKRLPVGFWVMVAVCGLFTLGIIVGLVCLAVYH